MCAHTHDQYFIKCENCFGDVLNSHFCQLNNRRKYCQNRNYIRWKNNKPTIGCQTQSMNVCMCQGRQRESRPKSSNAVCQREDGVLSKINQIFHQLCDIFCFRQINEKSFSVRKSKTRLRKWQSAKRFRCWCAVGWLSRPFLVKFN